MLSPFADGNVVSIASSDPIPAVKDETDVRRSLLYFALFLLGIALMVTIRLLGSTLG